MPVPAIPVEKQKLDPKWRESSIIPGIGDAVIVSKNKDLIRNGGSHPQMQ